jgi:serine protease AprX
MKKIFITLFSMLMIYSTALPQAEIDPQLSQALLNNAAVEVVVTFKGNSSPTQVQLALLNQIGITKGFSFKSLPIAGVVATASQINLLSNNPEVRSLYLNKELEYYNENGTALTGVDRLRKDQTITSNNGGLPVSGKNVTILINDSGIDGTHEDIKYPDHLKQNVLGSTNPHAYDALLPIVYLENIPNTDNNSGHGTHCAGIAGGRGVKSAGKYEGVAPGADLIGYGSGAVLLVLDAIGGFDYALTNQFNYNIRVISNSWGTSGTFSPDNPVNVASKLAYDRRIVVCFSSSNSGPGENTHNPYAVAPWVISVAAGDKFGTLGDFSSRGVKDQTGTFTIDGESWTWENRPTITGPGVDVISTRAIAPLPVLGDDADIEPAYLPFYTKMSGTSMSCPHVAGISALILEANPSLSPAEVKQIIQLTATNIPNREPWEVGAGYVNAYAAVLKALGLNGYGSSVNMMRTFNSNAIVDIARHYFTIDFNPVAALSPTNNEFPFTVAEGTTAIEARVDVHGIVGEEGNPVNLILIAPDGTEYLSGIYVAFTLYHDRTVAVTSPMPGNWKVKLDGLHGDPANPVGAALPELVNGYVKLITALGFTGLSDIAGNPAEASIKFGISSRLIDGLPGGVFRPNDNLTRIDLANYLMMGQGVRQFLPSNGSNNFNDITSDQKLVVESVTAKGSPLRDRFQVYNGVMQQSGTNQFNPAGTVNRTQLAYSLVQSLGLQADALSFNSSSQVTVNYNGEEIPIDDANQIPAEYKGYVQLALNLNLINAYFSLVQGPFDLQPKLHAAFKPLQNVSRAEFAVIITRTHYEWTNQALAKETVEETFSLPSAFSLEQNYPNPFNPSTTINYALPQDEFVTLEVFNAIGEKVATLINELQTAGSYNIKFNAGEFSSGMYIYKIKAGNFEKTIKMTLIK